MNKTNQSVINYKTEMMYISTEQTAGCYPVMFSIVKSPRHLTIKFELIFWFGDYPIIVKRSNNRQSLEKEIDKIITQSKIGGWKRQRSKNEEFWSEPWKESEKASSI